MNTWKTQLVGTALASGAFALVLSGCGAYGSSNNTSSSGNGGSGAAASTSSSGAVTVASVHGTRVLVDSGGHTLYSTTAEKGGKVHCVAGCTSFWGPVKASRAQLKADSAKVSRLGVVRRPDGTSQLTFRGLPLYTFAQDGVHQLKGNGFSDDFQGTHFVWSAATTSGSTTTSGGGSNGSSNSGGGGYGGY
ncbi:MAG: COG4315 family predicted lipoprotein [Marmoricola sp.]